MVDYKNLEEVIVTTQEELNQVPLDYVGQVYINSDELITIWQTFLKRVIVQGNSRVVVVDNGYVVGKGNSIIFAGTYSTVLAWDNSSVIAYGESNVKSMGNNRIFATDHSTVEAWGNAKICSRGCSHITTNGMSTVEAGENSFVEVYGGGSVVAHGNSQIINHSPNANIKVYDNAREISMPKDVYEFLDFYKIKHNKTTATFYKAVRKTADGVYYSDYNPEYIYTIGEYKEEFCDPNVQQLCSYGIHISPLDWALWYSADWENCAILEVETNIEDIVIPLHSEGKVRTPKVKVIREVPPEEWGFFEKLLKYRTTHIEGGNKMDTNG